jgi:hypothetical protein
VAAEGVTTSCGLLSPHGVSLRKQRRIYPDVLIVWGQEETVPGGQSQVRQDLWAALHEVPNVKRRKEVGVVCPLADPDVPPARITRRRMSKTVQRIHARPDTVRNAGNHVQRRGLGPNSKPPASVTRI